MVKDLSSRRSRRLKFHFEGVNSNEDATLSKKTSPSARVSSDDILESLQKHSRNGGSLDDELEEGAEQDVMAEEGLTEYNDNDNVDMISTSPILRNAIMKTRNSHRLGFALLMLVALAIVGMYESMVRYSSPFYYFGKLSSLNTIMIFGNPMQLIIVSLIGIVALALMMRHHRNSISRTIVLK